MPAEYQEVEFIIGQGSQYIDTGYVLNSECRVQGRYDLYELKGVLALFGSRNDQYNNSFAIFNVSAAPRVDYGNTLATHSFSYAGGNNRNVLEFDLNAGIATVNGNTYAFADSLKPFTCPSTAIIFATHTGDTIDARCPKGEIVYLKITDENGIVVRDMIPCYRKSDAKPGMYDLVGKRFYTNAGIGEFIAGPDVASIYGGTVTLNEDGSADIVSTKGNIPSYNGEILLNTWISSMDVYTEGATPTIGAQVVYDLEEPVSYHIDDAGKLASFNGTNNVWADTGDVTVTYVANSAKFSFNSPLNTYNFSNLKLFGNTYIEHGKG